MPSTSQALIPAQQSHRNIWHCPHFTDEEKRLTELQKLLKVT
jgi:hypothetical protein